MKCKIAKKLDPGAKEIVTVPLHGILGWFLSKNGAGNVPVSAERLPCRGLKECQRSCAVVS